MCHELRWFEPGRVGSRSIDLFQWLLIYWSRTLLRCARVQERRQPRHVDGAAEHFLDQLVVVVGERGADRTAERGRERAGEQSRPGLQIRARVVLREAERDGAVQRHARILLRQSD